MLDILFPATPTISLLDLTFSQWWLDYSSSVVVILSLWYLFSKHAFYWYLSILATFLYFVFYTFSSNPAYLFAGLQVGYLIFALHGMVLWRLEHRRDTQRHPFNEPLWYNLGWGLTLLIFGYATYATASSNGFADVWGYLQFTITALALIANWGTTRKWAWSWGLWILVNALYAVYFAHYAYWGQFVLQFILGGMSVWGWIEWIRQDRITRAGKNTAEAPTSGAINAP